MDPILIITIALSELIALMLIMRTWMRDDYVFLKLLLSMVLLVPVVGPLFYLFANDRTPPQSENLKNDLPRGWCTDRWISVRSIYKYSNEKQKSRNDVSIDP